MARRTDSPVPPRDAAPDLPARLEAVTGLARHGDLLGARVADVTGAVDAAHCRLTESVVEGMSADRLDLTGAVLTDVRLAEPRATEIVARDGRWRSVEIVGGRIGTLDLLRGELDGVVLRDVRIDYLSLPSARIADLQVVGCVIGTMDLPEADVTRVAFQDTRVDEVDTRGLRATDLDLRGLEALSYTEPAALRGATMSAAQLLLHAGAFARALGIRVLG
ncbi:hypothetical protein FVP74_04895 [Microbacterium saccharophilum]|uniref:Pentapeptide repeat-containing protein n=1 Tax=Microbacterium saccharophilum TaxID=1213358 RepID=A0A5C8I6R5_9MICO|nr:hypothetical protein [Microbacterium saccharophilum]TXK13941.1 hypothetical protein FVP74_04895 [Microbacterium saccharophilum]GEP48919.1 hypothetical protein MSA03_24270 [Microbacterium saccharophilum]